MKWRDRKESDNVDDRSLDRSSRKVPRRPTRSGRTKKSRSGPRKSHTKTSALGIGCLLLIFLPITCVFGGIGAVGNRTTSGETNESKAKVKRPADDELKKFVKVVVNDADTFWKKKKGSKYKTPTLVFYDYSTASSCGKIRKSMGPLYCVLDKKIYISPDWLAKMDKKRDINGDFAIAFVIAHEFGHHVQNVEGRSWKIIRRKRKSSKKKANELARRMELQADCYAGMFAAHSKKKGWLESGDIDEAINAAKKMGDDHIRQKYGGDLDPSSFRHGSSTQRRKWFDKGFKSPSQATCDTFKAKSL